MEWYDTNNFWCYLPGQRYRDKEPQNPENTRLIADLDRIIEEMDFDAKSCAEAISRGNKFVIRALNMLSKGEGDREKAIKIGDKGDAIRIEAQKKLCPVYEAMLKLGYDRNRLTA